MPVTLENPLRFQPSRMVQGLDEGAEKSAPFRLLK
jgi:hypothetical protein